MHFPLSCHVFGSPRGRVRISVCKGSLNFPSSVFLNTPGKTQGGKSNLRQVEALVIALFMVWRPGLGGGGNMLNFKNA